MSEESPMSMVFAEKIFGIVLTCLGIILAYNTVANMAVAGMTGAFSIIGGIILVLLGIILLTSQTSAENKG